MKELLLKYAACKTFNITIIPCEVTNDGAALTGVTHPREL
jgi:hypothetical protein